MDDKPSLDNSTDRSRVADFWLAYCRAAKLSENTPYQAWHFGDSRQLAHELAELVLNGPKRATAGLGVVADALPHTAAVPDGYSVVTEMDGTPRAVIRTTVLERRKFCDVDARICVGRRRRRPHARRLEAGSLELLQPRVRVTWPTDERRR